MRPSFLKQKIMLRVLYALAPVGISAVFFFGWRVAAILAVSVLFCFLTEWVMVNRRKGKISYACFVTAALYGLSLPPTIPFWIVAVGAIVAILFGKEVFGGFGRNVFNPAIVGRAFVYVCFPIELTSRFVPAFKGFPGGFGAWSFETSARAQAFLVDAGLSVSDAVTAATPMWARRDFGYVADTLSLALGNIGGLFTVNDTSRILAAGSSGEGCAIVILLGGIYLLVTKTAQWRLMVSPFVGAIALNLLLRNGLGIDGVPPVHFTVFSGALIFASVFMVTDPVSAPNLPLSHWMYGIFIGAMIVFFRYKGIFAGGVAFSILLGNMLAPSLDLWIKRVKDSKASAGGGRE
jgi:Na+-transporting NADH:ubiquinone oxidoreductase subunit B